MNKVRERRSYSAGDKLPKSTGEIDSTLLGKTLELYWGNGSTGVSCIPPGNNLILRLPGMLVEGYLYTPLGNIVSFDGKPTLLEESIAESGLTLWGVEVTWLRSSVEPTLVPWWTEQLDRLDKSLLPLFLMSPVINPLSRMQIFKVSN